jgi:hypothetical protein
MLGTASTNAVGAWNFTTATLVDGTHAFSASAIDVAGNSSAMSSALSVTVNPDDTLVAVNHAPVVTSSGPVLARNQIVAASSLFAVNDVDRDAITTYQFMDNTAGATSGHFVVNGVTQAAQTVVNLSAAQLAQTTFQAGTTADALKVRAFDGTVWSDWTDVSVAVQNHTPVTAASQVTAGRNQTIAATSLFTATDADQDTISAYQFLDGTAASTSGHFVINGVEQAAQSTINVSAAQLANLMFETGSGPNSILVRAFDGTAWGNWTDISPVVPNQASVITTAGAAVARNQSVAASSLFTLSDADGDAAVTYQFWDGNADANSGHFVVNGVTQAAQTIINISAAQFAQTTFDTGSTADNITVRVFDGTAWSNWTDVSVAIPNHAAVVSSANATAARGQSIAIGSLFSVTDSDGDSILSYQIYDNTSAATSGHFVVNGVDQAAQSIITLSAAQLAQTVFHAGTTADAITVRAFDGSVWSDWTNVSPSLPNHTPIVASLANVLSENQLVSASSLFSTSDADGDAIAGYQFFDNTTGSSSGHFVVNGVVQAAQTVIDVSPGALSQTSFYTGTGLNDVYMRVFDGSTWSDWTSVHADLPNHAPVVTAGVTVASPNQSLAVSSLFSVNDADNDAIASYQFWDQTTDATSGHFAVNGTSQDAQTIIDVTAAQLSQTTFHSGSGTDDLYVRAYDGFTWSDWVEFNVINNPNNSPANTLAQVNGTANNDTLTSTSANELMTGGYGNDTFVFAANFGKDVITDFQPIGAAHDVIEVSNSVFNDFAVVLAHATQVAADVVITADAQNSITLKNVTLANLQSDHFHFT